MVEKLACNQNNCVESGAPAGVGLGTEPAPGDEPASGCSALLNDGLRRAAGECGSHGLEAMGRRATALAAVVLVVQCW